MGRLNTRQQFTQDLPKTHQGAPGPIFSPEQKLRRRVMACMLWEKDFYEDGQTIADAILELVPQVDPVHVQGIAIEARRVMKVRHAPLLVAAAMAKHFSGSSHVGETIAEVIQRADELSEFLAIYAKVNGVDPKHLKPVLSNQVRVGVAKAFQKFDAYQLAKYDRSGPIRLRDALFLCHARPKDEEQNQLWKQLIYGTLPTPDTWETKLSAGADKKETFERLLREQKLGYFALLRNLRGMMEVKVEEDLIRHAILERKGAEDVLPFRYLAAARHCPQLEPEIEHAMMRACDEMPSLPGKTIILVDVSNSMNMHRISEKSEMTRMDAACALAALIKCQTKRVFSFSDKLVEVPPRNGMAMIDVVRYSQPNMWTYLGAAVTEINKLPCDRLIVITDEQSSDPVPGPAQKGWMINIAADERGVGTTTWNRVDGWSEGVLRYIYEMEVMDLEGQPMPASKSQERRMAAQDATIDA